MTTARVFDDTPCTLGEGPLWHPIRGQLFWFDIMGRKLLTREAGATRVWQFEEHVSAAGWIDRDTLLVASETALFRFDLVSGAREDVCALEAGNSLTRSNDGRVDPWGGFWIGTMGKMAEPRAGAIYRFHRGRLRRLYDAISIPNAICFSPDRKFAYFTDTPTKVVLRQALDAETGDPKGEPFEWLDLNAEGLNPDGAVVDASGNFWNAQWGAHRVACYDPNGTFLKAVDVGGLHSSCPAFGGPDLGTLYCTTARQGIPRDTLLAHPENGMTFAAAVDARGQPEHQVIL